MVLCCSLNKPAAAGFCVTVGFNELNELISSPSVSLAEYMRKRNQNFLLLNTHDMQMYALQVEVDILTDRILASSRGPRFS